MSKLKMKMKMMPPPQVEKNARANRSLSSSSSSSSSSVPFRPGEFFGKAALGLAFFAFSLALCEFALTVLDLGMEEFMRPDALLGVAHLEGKWVTHKAEGFSRSYLSSLGLVDEEVAPEPGLKRIAFLGDSKTEALQVPDRDRFCRLIEASFNKEGKRSCRTINFGTSSYGPLVECLQYLKLVSRFKPEITVLVYNYGDVNESGGAGLVNNMLPRPVASLEPVAPGAAGPGKAGALKVDYQYLDNFLAGDSCRFNMASEWFRRHSRIYQVCQSVDMAMRSDNKLYTKLADALVKPLANKLGRLYRGKDQTSDRNRLEREKLLTSLYRLDREVSHERLQAPLSKKVAGGAETQAIVALESASRENIELTARLISILRKACAEDGGKLVVVGLPAPDNSMFYFKELAALKKLAEREGFLFIDGREGFPKLQAMEANPYYYTAHFSPAGHRIMAQIIGRGLEPYCQP